MAAHRSSASNRRPSEPPATGSAAQDTEPDPAAVARAIALRQLTAAPRSRAELERAMARRGVPRDVVARVLDRFTEVGLVNDAAYAELVVRSRHTASGLARPALAQELRGRGISADLADEALKGIDDADERGAARALVTRKVATMRGLDPERQRRRLVAMLGRRGYPTGLALTVVNDVLGSDPGASEGDPELDVGAGSD